jgi:hypothetical protein
MAISNCLDGYEKCNSYKSKLPITSEKYLTLKTQLLIAQTIKPPKNQP